MRRIERARKWDSMRSDDSNPAYPLSLLLAASWWWYKMPLFIHAVLLTSSIATHFLIWSNWLCSFHMPARGNTFDRSSDQVFGGVIEELARGTKGKSWAEARYFNERRVINNPLSGAAARAKGSFIIFPSGIVPRGNVKLIIW